MARTRRPALLMLAMGSVVVVLLGLSWMAFFQGEGAPVVAGALPAVSQLELEALADDAGSELVAGEARPLVSDARRGVRGTSSLSGRVVDGAGDPVAGVRVSVIPAAMAGPRPSDTVSDDEGRYAFTDLPAGNTGVSAHPAASPVVFAWVSLRDGQQTRDVDLRLVLHARLTGIVLDALGDPWPERQIALRTKGGLPWPQVFNDSRGLHTDAAGRFVIEALRAGIYQLSAPPWPKQPVMIDYGEERHVVLSSPVRQGIVVQVQSRAESTRRVEVQVFAEQVEDMSLGDSVDSRPVDSADRVEITLRVPGTYTVVGRHPEGGRSESQQVEIEAGAVVHVSIDMPTGSLSGRLVSDIDGSPTVGKSVWLVEAGAPVQLPENWGQRSVVKTDDEGRFHFVCLAAGQYDVIVPYHSLHPAGPGLRPDNGARIAETIDVLVGEEVLLPESMICGGAVILVKLDEAIPTPDEIKLSVRLAVSRLDLQPAEQQDGQLPEAARFYELMLLSNEPQVLYGLPAGRYRLELKAPGVIEGPFGVMELQLGTHESQTVRMRVSSTESRLMHAALEGPAEVISIQPGKGLQLTPVQLDAVERASGRSPEDG
jgi:hypothetical protein